MGAGFNALAQAGIENARKQASLKGQLSDEERETHLADYNNSIQSLQQKISQDPNNSGQYQTQLDQVVKDRTALFHPSQGPGAMAHLGRMLWSHVHGNPTDAPRVATTPVAGAPASTLPGMTPGAAPISTPELPATNMSRDTHPDLPVTADAARQRMAQDLSFAAPMIQQSNPYVKFKQQYKEAYPQASQEQIDQAANVKFGFAPKPVADKPTKGTFKEYKLKDGTMAWLDITKPETIPDGAQPIGGQPHQSTAALETYIRSWFPTGGNAKQREWAMARYEKLTHGSTSSDHQAIGYDAQGNPVEYTLHSENRKDFGAGGPPPADESQPSSGTPQGVPVPPRQTGKDTPASLKSRAPKMDKKTTDKSPLAAPSTKGTSSKMDPNIAKLHKNTPSQTKASEDVDQNVKLSSLADDAMRNPSATKDKNLALTIIRTAAGRVNMSEYDILTKKAGLGNSLEAWANSATTGELPTNIRKQLVDLSHSMLKAAKDAQSSSMGNDPAGDDFLLSFGK